MKKQLYQWNFVINGLIPDQAKLKRKVWLKKGELLLEQKGDKLYAYLLGDNKFEFSRGDKIASYLKFSCLISNNSPDLESCSGIGLKSKEDLGKVELISCSIKSILPKESIEDIEKYAHKFISFIDKLHDKYIQVVCENEFMEIALDYFYEAKKKFPHGDERLY